MESHRRTLVKSITYRISGLFITVLITWMVTGEARIAASVGALDFLLKIGSFYLHERAWNRMNFGRLG